MSIIRTKLHRPRTLADVVSRDRLNALMDRGLKAPLTLVSAPAGYGKSVLVSRWADSLDCPCAWISLDESDSDLTQFFDYLVTALDASMPGSFPEAADLVGAGQLPPPSVLAGPLINELDTIDGPFVLILDDYHRIEFTSKVHVLLSHLLEHPPRYLHLVLISRRDPPLALWALRAASMLNEIRLADLRFHDEEVVALLNASASTEVGAEAIADLQRQVEGWAVGLRLACLALGHAPDPTSFLSTLEGGIPHTQGYLLREVLAQQSPELGRCMLRSSILDRFCPSLIDAVCLSDAQATPAAPGDRKDMDTHLWQEMFTIGLDDHGEWFRHHHLFRKLLREQLSQVATDREIATLHLRASTWFTSRGLITESIEHCLAADDVQLASELVERHAESEFASDHWYVVERWLAMLPVEARHARPMLLLAEAWVRNLQYQLARVPPLIDAAEALLCTEEPTPASERAAMGQIALFRGYLTYYEGRGEASLCSLEDAVSSLSQTESPFVADAQMFLGLARCMVGRQDQAVAALRASLDAADPSQIYLQGRLIGGLLFGHLLGGDLHAAQTQALRLSYLSSEHDLRLNQAWSRYALGWTRLQSGEFGAALDDFEEAVELRYLMEPMAAADAIAGLALTRQLMGLEAQATRGRDQLRGFAQELNGTAYFAISQSCSARLALLCGNTAQARQWARSVEDNPKPHSLFIWLEVPQITAARILIDEGSPTCLERACKLLGAVREYSSGCRFQCQIIEVAVLDALALERQGKQDRAAEALREAISQARPGSWLRPFLESGAPLVRPLERLREQGDESDFIDRILRSLGNARRSATVHQDASGVRTEPSVTVDRLYPDVLTNRELDIIELLAQRLPSKEIAGRLFISIHTVNAHLKRIYRKLDVNSRRQAVERAARAGLIDRR